MQDAVVNIIRVSLRDHQRQGRPMERHGNQLGHTVPAARPMPARRARPNDFADRARPAADVEGDVPARRPGCPELADDPRFATADARWENRDALNAIVEEWTQKHTKHEVMRGCLGDAGVPCGACQDTGEVLADPHLEGARDDRRHRLPDPRHPTRPSAAEGEDVGIAGRDHLAACPLLGELYTDELLAELCGVDPDQLTRMREDGVRYEPGPAWAEREGPIAEQ